MLISVVIRVRNAEKDLKTCLMAIKEQQVGTASAFEFVVVDNESTDASVEVARHFFAKVVSISRSDFSWGRALNRGIACCQGEFVIIISADVEPVSAQWLSLMLNTISSSNMAAVYGRQIARSNAPIDEVARLATAFPSEAPPASMMPMRTQKGHLCFLSNACVLIRRSAWEKVKFDEASDGAEEQPWMEELLRRGYRYAYAADALAYHSHRDPLARAAYRLWELHRERLKGQGKKPSLGNSMYAAGAICKRRIKNVIMVKASLQSKIEGVVFLPFEVLMFLFAGGLEIVGVERHKIRNFMWQ